MLFLREERQQLPARRLAQRSSSCAFASWQPFGSRSGWNDEDSVEIGDEARDSLTAPEQQIVLSLWSLAGAPLILGTDFTELTSVDKAMLENRAVIAIDNEGIAARRLIDNGSKHVFAKRQPNGIWYVGIFDTDRSARQNCHVQLAQLGLGYAIRAVDARAAVALPVPVGAGGAAAAEPAADRRVQLLPGRPQPDRRLLPVERLLRAHVRRDIPVQAVHPGADLRDRGEEPGDPGRRQHPDQPGLPVHRGGDRHAHAEAGGRRREICPRLADRAAAAGADRGLGVPAPAQLRAGRPDPRARSGCRSRPGSATRTWRSPGSCLSAFRGSPTWAS